MTALLETPVAHPTDWISMESSSRIEHTGSDDVRILVVDTRRERRQVMRRLLEVSFKPAEIAEADSRAAAIELVDRCHPELVVLEIQMPTEEGLDTITALLGASPRPRIVVCSFERDPAVTQGALDRGADTYLTKPVSATQLRKQAELIMKDRMVKV
jgi:two-component system response regulator DegU